MAPLRTWGSCTFDSHRGQLVYWGGGHCGYGGNDYDFYDVADNTWISEPLLPDYPPRVWNRGINLAGITFSGAPWIRHGRRIYAYDPVSRRVVNTKLVFLTGGYDPEPLRHVVPVVPVAGHRDDEAGYAKWTTWTFDRDAGAWELLCSGVAGLDLTVTTPHGVMAVDHDWGAVNDPDRPDQVDFDGRRVVVNAVYLLDVAGRRWDPLSGDGPWPQNLYEMTGLVHDSRRDRLLLHGGGPGRDELWAFDIAGRRWSRLDPAGTPPACRREAVYLPAADVLLTAGAPAGDEDAAGIYVYQCRRDRWTRLDVEPPAGRSMADVTGQNRCLAYDAERDVILMVLGRDPGDEGPVAVYGLRYCET